MKVTINAQNIGNMLNADVINLGQLQTMGEADRHQLLNELIRSIQERSAVLAKEAQAISADQMKSLGEELTKTVRTVATEPADAESRKKQAHTILENFRSSFGSVTDILLNAVKLAQVAGLFTGHL